MMAALEVCSDTEEEEELVSILYDGEEFAVPRELLEDEEVFCGVVSESTWREVLTEADRERLTQLLPPGTPQERGEHAGRVLEGEDVRFGNPVRQAWAQINKGEFCPDLREACQELRELKYQQYQHNQKCYYVKLLQDILVSRQEVMQKALLAGSLENMPPRCVNRKKRRSSLQRRADIKFRRIMRECREEWGEGEKVMSSDEENALTNEIADDAADPPITEEDYQKMLRQHRERRTMKKTDLDLVTRGLNMAKVAQRKSEKPLTVKSEVVGTNKRSAKERLSPDFSRKFSSAGAGGGGGGGGDRGREVGGEERGVKPRPSAESKAVYEAYGPVESGSRKDPPLEPVVLSAPLPQCKYLSFFSLLKHSFDPLNDRKGEISKITKSVRTVLSSAEAAGCPWLQTRSDWLDLVLSALTYISAEVGALSSFEPLPFFLPVVEFRDRIDHWKWMGHDRDSELELLVLCNHWLENVDRALEIVDYSDYEPPPPINLWTNFVFRQSTADEVARFKEQETFRYSQPHKSYTYNIHGFEAPVGPVKGARTYKKESGSRARGHALLIPDRPNCVTILSLVRDAASRLPNGEGTRVDLCVVVRDSQFIQTHISEIQLNNAVSGALDRLHYEKDPCVRYDSPRKVWIYLHRGRSEEDFERVQWACDMAAKQRKMITTRPRVKPRIVFRDPGLGEMVLMEGGPQTTPTYSMSASGGHASAGGRSGGGEGGRSGRRGAGKASQTGSSKSAGVKSALNPLAVVTSSGTPVVVASVVSRASSSHSPASSSDSFPLPLPLPLPLPTAAKHKPHTKKREGLSQLSVSRPVLSVAPPPSSLQEPDWESSDTEMPFLSSQPLGAGGVTHDSSSSWQSSEDEAVTGHTHSVPALSTVFSDSD